MGFDIERFDTRSNSERGMKMTVMRPGSLVPFVDDETKAPITITLLGLNSDAVQAVQRDNMQRRSDLAKKNVPIDEDIVEQENYATLCAATKEWSFTQMGGHDFPCTPENVRKLWAEKRWNWLGLQALGFIVNEGNFLAA